MKFQQLRGIHLLWVVLGWMGYLRNEYNFQWQASLTIIMQYNNGLKFSFSLHSQIPLSSHSTPKFPSIEIEKEVRPHRHKEAAAANHEENLLILSYFPTSKEKAARPESKGKRILEKYSHLTLLTHKERNEKDSRSVRSAQSNNSTKYARSKTEIHHSLPKSNKNRHSSVSSTSFKTHVNTLKGKSKTRSHSKGPTKMQLNDQSFKKRLFDERSVVKLTNNYFKQPESPKSRLADHASLFQQACKLSDIPDKGKSFKSILHKIRPVLRIGSRVLNNSKLEQMSKAAKPIDFEQDLTEIN